MLRDLTAEEKDLVARHSLPGGVRDALVNKAQLGDGLGVSQTTISAWLREGLPFEEAGTNGRAYMFRLSLAWAWRAARQAEDEAARAAGNAAVEQLQMALLGGDSAAPQSGLSLADQRKLLELEHLRAIAARDRGELIRREDVVAGLEEVFATLRDSLDALPDRLAREIGIDGAQIEAVERVCDDALGLAASAVAGIIGEAAADRGAGQETGAGEATGAGARARADQGEGLAA
ncbi:phage terminase Nu1 subunit (DNA packaging protein) [Roseovarius sp. MBR-154]|jgi:phage terminase Nu1 subunit (DNA packaging protein)